MNNLYFFLKHISLFAKLIWDTIFQIHFAKRLIHPYFNKIQNTYGINIKKSMKQRIEFYMYGSYYFGRFFSVLHNSKMTQNERKAMCLAGALLGIGDSLFDDETDFSHIRLFEMITQPESYIPSFYKDEMLLMIYKSLLENVLIEHRILVKNALKNAYYANVMSEKQKELQTDKNEVVKLSLKKGGTCGVFYRLCMNHELVNNENEAAYAMGELGQIIDDVFDVQEDISNNIITIITLGKSITNIIALFRLSCNETYKKIECLSLKKQQIYDAIYLLNIISNFALAFLYHIKDNVLKDENLDHIGNLKYSETKYHFSIKNIILICKLNLKKNLSWKIS